MPTHQQFNVSLPEDMAEALRAMVAAGAYASESEVLRDGLRVLLSRKDAVERWLHDEVGPSYDALKANPAQALSADDVRARLALAHDRYTSRKG